MTASRLLPLKYDFLFQTKISKGCNVVYFCGLFFEFFIYDLKDNVEIVPDLCKQHGRIQRGTRGPPPLKNHKIIGFSSR